MFNKVEAQRKIEKVLADFGITGNHVEIAMAIVKIAEGEIKPDVATPVVPVKPIVVKQPEVKPVKKTKKTK